MSPITTKIHLNHGELVATARRQLLAGVEFRQHPQVKPVLLSEAIREGARNTKEIHMKLYQYEGGRVVGCCVIGAALSAVARRGETLCYHDFRRYFPQWDDMLIQACPAGLCEWPHGAHRGVMSALIHLYDEHSQSREQIADYVETLERDCS